MSITCKFCLFKSEIEDEYFYNQENIEKMVQIINVLFNQKIRITNDEVRLICGSCKEKLESFYVYYLMVLENQVPHIEKEEIDRISPFATSVGKYSEHDSGDEIKDTKIDIFVEPVMMLDENVESDVKFCESGRKSKRLRGAKPEFSILTNHALTFPTNKQEQSSKNFSDDDYEPEEGKQIYEKPKPVKKVNPVKRVKPAFKKKTKKIKMIDSEDDDYEPPKPRERPSYLTEEDRVKCNELIQKYFGNKCDTCGDSTEYQTFKELNQHCKNEHGSNKHYICCGAYLSNRIMIYKHCLEHENPVQCNICGMFCVSNTFYVRHLFEAHGIAKNPDKNFICDLCNRRYKEKKTLESHMERVHLSTSKVSYVCETCSRIYRSAKSLDLHIRRDHLCEEQPKTQCPHCSRWILNSGMPFHLRQHLKLPETKQFKCDKCPQEFKGYHALTKHQKRHHSELSNQFQCPQCPKGFYTKRSFDEHFAVHTGENLYHCEWCDAGFKSMGNYLAHKRKLHTLLYEEQKMENLRKRIEKSKPL